MYFDHIYHLLQLFQDPLNSPFLSTQLCYLKQLNKKVVGTICLCIFLSVGFYVGMYPTYQDYTLKENWFSLSQQL